MGIEIEIQLGGVSFPSKGAAIEHCKAILYRGELGSVINGEDAQFVEALFYARPDKVGELGGREIVRYLRKMHRHNTPCFFAELEDGSLLDFSCMRLINAYPRSTAA
jgi:hypothetical protein